MIKFIVYFIEIIYMISSLNFIMSLTNTSEHFTIGMFLLGVFGVSLFLIVKLNNNIFKKRKKNEEN